MRMGLAGLLLIVVGVAVIAAGFYFDFSPWLVVPGGLLALAGLSLLDGAREATLSRFRHRASDAYEAAGDPDPAREPLDHNSADTSDLQR